MPDTINTADLKDDALNTRIAELSAEETVSPGPHRDSDTPTSTEADPNAAVGTQETKTPTGAETKPGADDSALLAGKYKTPDDLAKGITEITKKLSLPDFLLTEKIEAAKASGDWKPVEEAYKKLDAELTRRSEAEKAAKAAAQPEAKPDVSTLSQEEIARIRKETNERFNSELANHPVIQDLAEAGVEFPITKDTLAALKKTDYGLYMALRTAISEVQSKLEKEATGYAEALAGVHQATESARTEGTTYLTKINTDFSLGYTEDEMKAIIDGALRDRAVMEQKYGIDYPIKEAVQRHFWINRHEEALKRNTESSKAKGRAEHTEDLKKMKDKTTDTVSQARLPGSKNRSGISGKIDYTDQHQVSGASDDAIDQRLKEIASEKEA